MFRSLRKMLCSLSSRDTTVRVEGRASTCHLECHRASCTPDRLAETYPPGAEELTTRGTTTSTGTGLADLDGGFHSHMNVPIHT